MKKNKDKHKISVFPISETPADSFASVVTDPLGSYTGRPADLLDTPVQDADDL